jgi:hypothetical protein
MMAALVAMSLIVVTCSDRDRGNPFDPANHETSGTPIELSAIPNEEFAALHWYIPEGYDIEGGELLRSYGGTAPTSVLQGLLGAGSTRDYLYPESPLGREYWLEVTVDGWNGVHRSDTAAVILSSGMCWVASGYDGVFLVSPTTSALFPGIQLGSFLVDMAPDRRSVWAAGAPGGIIYQVEESADSIIRSESFSTSLDVSSITVGNDGMVLLAHSSGLTWLDPRDYSLDPWVEDPEMRPTMVRLAPDTMTAWAYAGNSHLLRFTYPSTVPTGDWAIQGVSAISPAPNDVCWIAAQGDLYRAETIGTSVSRVITNVTALAAVDDQRCWVADQSLATVRLVSGQGAIIRSCDVSSPGLLAYSASDSMLWVAGTDRKIWKFLPDLRTAMKVIFPTDPWSLATPGE